MAKIQNVIYGTVKNNVNAVTIMTDITWIIIIFANKRMLIVHKSTHKMELVHYVKKDQH